MHIIVTGGCGYKGSVLVRELLVKGYQVTIIDAGWFGWHFAPHQNLVYMQDDIRTIDRLSTADALIHLAAVANDPSCELDPKLSWEVNVLATHNLLNLCVQAGIPQFIYASSGSVYGISDAPNVVETTKLVPISEYNKTKMIAEKVVLSFKDKLNVTILRPATVCGISPRQRFDVAVNALSINAKCFGKIKVDGGSQVRPNVHIRDIVDAYIWCVHNKETYGQIFNVGFENLTLTEIAEKVAKIIPATIEYVPSNDPRSYRLCSQKILDLGFNPRYKVEDAIKEIRDSNVVPSDINYNMKWMQLCSIK